MTKALNCHHIDCKAPSSAIIFYPLKAMDEMFSPDAHDSDLLNDDLIHSHRLELDQSFGSPALLHDMQNDRIYHIPEPDLANSWNSGSSYHTEVDHRNSNQDGNAWDYNGNSLVDHPHSKEHLGAAGSCSLCHGTGSYWSAADRQQVKCIRCGGSGIG